MSALPHHRLVLAGIGSRGDVQPLLALGQTLRQRGHSVRIAAPPDFADWVQALGFDFVPVGVHMQQFLMDNPAVLTGNALRAGPVQQQYFRSELPRQAHTLLAACADADALVWAGLALTAPSVAQRLGIPALGVVYSSCMLPSAMHAPATVRARGLPHGLNRVLWWLHDRFATRILGGPLNQARRQIGLADVDLHSHLMHWACSLAVDEDLFPTDPAWPAHVQRANFFYLDDPATLDPALQAWLSDGEPPVYVGFGSMGGMATQRVDALLREALQASGRRCLVGAGWAGLGGAALPAHWRVVSAAPHALLFAQVAAVVHHGGAGTTAQALRAGVPQVVLPLILDQYHHAHSLWRAGLIPKPVAMERITAQQLSASITAALAWPTEPLQAVARRLQHSDGRGQTAKHIEDLLMPGKSRFRADTL